MKEAINVNLKVIEHHKHRYPTVGDWQYDGNGNLAIRVSKMSDSRYEKLVMLHEFIEAILCENSMVDEDDVTKFDMEYEANRAVGNTSEPGDSPLAPYHRQHRIATAIETLIAAELEVDWAKYEKEINSL